MGVEAALIATVAGGVLNKVESDRAATQTKRAGRQRAEALRAEAAAERERARRLGGAQRARVGAAGVSGAGSPLFGITQSLQDSLLVRERLLAGSRNAMANARAQARALRIQGTAGLVGSIGQAAQFHVQNVE